MHCVSEREEDAASSKITLELCKISFCNPCNKNNVLLSFYLIYWSNLKVTVTRRRSWMICSKRETKTNVRRIQRVASSNCIGTMWYQGEKKQTLWASVFRFFVQISLLVRVRVFAFWWAELPVYILLPKPLHFSHGHLQFMRTDYFASKDVTVWIKSLIIPENISDLPRYTNFYPVKPWEKF